MKKQTLIIVLLFAVTFGGGLGSGYFMRGMVDARSGAYDQDARGQYERRGDGLRAGNQREGQADREMQLQRFRARMIEELNLSEDQIEPFFDIMVYSRRSMRDIREDNRIQLRRELTAQAEEMHSQVKDLLTEAQFERWIALSQRMERNGGGSGR